MEKEPKFVLLGAGLPRTGTMSTRAALKTLLNGDVYHMMELIFERPEHKDLWKQALNKTITKEGWKTILGDYVAGVDYPVANFYKEILEVYPDVKVLLNVRDPVRWYESVRDSILRISRIQTSWPCTWFLTLMGTDPWLPGDASDAVPTSSSKGYGMFSAVTAGQEAAVEFFHEHVAEVKKHVPKDKLLVFEVKQGWKPLCDFLDLPVPDQEFPRVNDTQAMQQAGRNILAGSWFMIVLLPLGLCLLSYFNNTSLINLMLGYACFLLLLRFFGRNSLDKITKDRLMKQKTD